MAEFSSYPAGSPCWIDLMSPEVEAAADFYGRVFGWEARPEFDPDGNRIYTNFLRDGKMVAGLAGTPPGAESAPAFWNTYIATENAEQSAAVVKENGGGVMFPPMQVMNHGTMAIFTDPTGAAFSVWEAADHTGAQVANESNTWSWNELMSRDLDTALDFYSTVFGWTYDAQDMGPIGTYNVIEGGNHGGLGGMMAMPGEMPEQVPNHWAVYFMVDDVDATLAAVAEAGGQTVQEPWTAPGVGRIAIAHDPQGGSFCLLQPESGR